MKVPIRVVSSGWLRASLSIALCGIALDKSLFNPFECTVGNLLNGVIEEIRKGRYDGETGECWSPSANTSVLGLVKDLLRLLDSRMDGECW